MDEIAADGRPKGDDKATTAAPRQPTSCCKDRRRRVSVNSVNSTEVGTLVPTCNYVRSERAGPEGRRAPEKKS